MEDTFITIDTYHDYMCEALDSLRSGLACFREATKISEEDDLKKGWLYKDAGIRCRYAFLTAANALEASANALLLDLEISRALYEDFEKLSTLLKFEVVCMAHGKKLDRSNNLYGRIKEIVQCRNEFVHPKPSKAICELSSDGLDLEIKVKKTKERGYPISFSSFEPMHARDAIGDILRFVSWVVFDVLELKIRDGALRLGYGSSSSNGTVISLAYEYGFDVRTFGEENENIK